MINALLEDLLQVDSDQQSEELLLETFCKRFHDSRDFCSGVDAANYVKLLRVLLEQRLCGTEGSHLLAVLKVVRILSRDTKMRCYLGNEIVLSTLVKLMKQLRDKQELKALTELTNIVQKVSGTEVVRGLLVAHGVHHECCQLLQCDQLSLVQPALCVLTNLAKSEACREAVVGINCVEQLLKILTDYELTCQRLAADLLLLLVKHQGCRDHVIIANGVSVLLSVLHGNDVYLLLRLVTVLERLVERGGDHMRQLGAIPIILALLRDDVEPGSHGDGNDVQLRVALLCGCCSFLTQLLLLSNDNVDSVVQANGVYIIARHVIATSPSHQLQKHACRALRFVFSVERNRQLFKRMFVPEVFEQFLRVGHYVNELPTYAPLVKMINSLSVADHSTMLQNIKSLDKDSEPIGSIGGYQVLEYLGAGAFGTVYKVRRPDSDHYYAMKEIKSSHATLGQTQEERERHLGHLFNEVNIVREQLQHPNIINYYKVFREGDSLFIVMELIEGASLLEHCNSLKEKRQSFPEPRIWSIFVQLVQALRYIHKEMHIVHRDLTAANIMLTSSDHLILMDFGLAKQKQRELSVMQSVVGTMVYWCPELVQNEPYTEKADVWAAGCLLYLMASLCYPFHSSNLLALAKQIVECDYQPLPSNKYSDRLTNMIARCLIVDTSQRPDILEVASSISDIIMKQFDHVMQTKMLLEKRLDREKSRLATRNTRHTTGSSSHDLPTNCWKSCDLEASDSVFVPQWGRGPRDHVSTDHVSTSSKHLSTDRRPSLGVSLSPTKLRQILDPTTSLMAQLQRILCITQLAPSLHPCSGRTLAKVYLHRLTSCDPQVMKSEMYKLHTGADQVMELLSQQTEQVLIKKALVELGSYQGDDSITYQQFQELLDHQMTFL